MKKLMLFVAMLLPMMASADAVEIDGIYYNLITKAKVAEVTSNPNRYTGTVIIPESVTYQNVNYSVTSIGEDAFHYCSGLTSVTIPNSVITIGNSAFDNCSGLTSVIIPNSVESIGSSAFCWCSGLTSITIPDNVTSIGGYAFMDCLGLTSISIGKNLTYIGIDAFYGCTCLNSVHISDLEAWFKIPFASDRENPLSQAHHLYLNGEELKNLVIPNSVTIIGSFAFSGCFSLTSVTIPNSVTSIGSGAFSGCSGLTSITIPNSVTSIGGSTFSGCSGLKSITIGSGISTIGYWAFALCQELTDFYCYAVNAPSTMINAFENSYTEYITLHVPAESVNAYKSAEPWKNFGTIVPLGDTPEPQKCATPVINNKDGKLSFSCDTKDVDFVTNVECLDNKKYYDKEISLSAKYKVSVYAKKVGYDDSDVATAEIDVRGLKGDVNGDGLVNVTDIVMTVSIIMDASAREMEE